MSSTPPKLFISYSWTTPDHEAWVVQLATELREKGIDVILDKWDLRAGHDSYAFMEKMVNDKEVKKVVLVCDRVYASKANARSGGVGVEAQIISPELYAKGEQDKFVAIVVERDDDGKAFLPIYYKSRIYIDLSDASRYAENFEQLLRWAFDKPVHVKPELGKAPRFLVSESNVSLGTTAKARRAADALRSDLDCWEGAVGDYFTAFSQNLERFRMPPLDGERDDQFIQNIESFLPFRNEAIDVFFALAQYQGNDRSAHLLHRFVESLLPYLDRPEHISSWNEGDFDNFRFIIHELYLYSIAILLKYERFEAVGTMLKTLFFLPTQSHGNTSGMVPFGYIYQPVRLAEIRSSRLKLNRISLRADLLEKRSHDTGVSFPQIMQADFVLFLRDCFGILADVSNDCYQWWPLTLALVGRQYNAFEVFARSSSKAYFSKVCKIFDISSKSQLDTLMEAFALQRLTAPRFSHVVANPARLMSYQQIATKP